MLRAIELCPLPVVAVVQGDAIAGGNELALHCDLVVASDKARFGMSLAQVGLAPNWFLAKKLMEVLGPVTTREMLLLGDPLPSTKLHALGLIARCVPADQLEAEAEKVIGRLANNAPLSLKAMKALTVRQLEIRDHIKHDDIDALVVAAMQSQDAQEGMKAIGWEQRNPVPGSTPGRFKRGFGMAMSQHHAGRVGYHEGEPGFEFTVKQRGGTPGSGGAPGGGGPERHADPAAGHDRRTHPGPGRGGP